VADGRGGSRSSDPNAPAGKGATGVTVEDAMSSVALGVSENESLLAVIKKMSASGAPAVTVLDSRGGALGSVTRWDMLQLVAEGADLDSTKVGGVVGETHCLSPDDSLESAKEVMSEVASDVLPVVADGQVVGILTRTDANAHLRLARVLGPNIVDLITEMSSSESMFRGSRGNYVIAGASALQCIRSAMQAAGKTAVESILDFPSGHGRVLRVLKAAFPEARLTAGDIDAEGVAFCARAFGAVPLYPEPDPERIDVDDEFDLIWCGSLFTHLDGPRWRGFLDLFARCLATDGLLIFTTHGRHAPRALRAMGVPQSKTNAMLEDYNRTGIGHVANPKVADWGLSIASPEWVRAQIDDHPKLRLVSSTERAWEPPWPRQDVFSCASHEGPNGRS